MKILFYIHSLSTGGAERTVAYLSKYFVNKNHQVTIILNTNKIFYDVDKRVKIYTLDYKKGSRLRQVISRIKLFRRAVREYNPDVVICLMYTAIFYTLFINRKIKVIGSERSNPENNLLMDRILKHVLFNRVDGMIFQTLSAQKYYPKKIRENSIVIPNAIGNEFIKNINSSPVSNRRKVISAVGRLNESKDYITLLDAFKIVHKKFPKFQLEIYGEGKQKDQLVDYVNRLDLEKYVKFMGVDKKAIIKISDSTCYVLSSISEGMPNSLIEALAIGLPCISTDCNYGPRDLIVDGYNGMLVPIKNPMKLADAIIFMIENPDFSKKCGDNALKIRDKLSVENIAEKYLNYIKSEGFYEEDHQKNIN